MLTAILILSGVLVWLVLMLMSEVSDLKSAIAMTRHKIEELETRSARDAEFIATMQKTANGALGRIEDRLGTRSPSDEISFEE